MQNGRVKNRMQRRTTKALHYHKGQTTLEGQSPAGTKASGEHQGQKEGALQVF